MARVRKGVFWLVVVLAGWFTLQAVIAAELPVTAGNARHIFNFFSFAMDQLTIYAGILLIMVAGIMFTARAVKPALAVLGLAAFLIVGVNLGGHQLCGIAPPDGTIRSCRDELDSHSEPRDLLSPTSILKMLLPSIYKSLGGK